MNVKIVYFSSTEPVIGKLSECGTRLIDPVDVLIAGIDEVGRAQITLSPFGSLHGVLKPVKEIKLDHAITDPVDAPAQMVQGYVQMTSGIALAAPNLAQGILRP